ncbi:DUF3073 domain-containing protein [Kocuria rhizophila]|uniref:DUF3073 domain-containing protein n=1 Tax=Kocuria rhizophila TaxID=72000 RepID=A0AAX2SAJ8_KOCRH|nr:MULTISPECIES: DUF3073 domain-containing protein [Kocuria]MXN61955.1 DUF3073 family protein [Bacillus sp. BGMRC0062]WIW69299.1 DUF3073 domain-containing protein [Kocuria sp. ChxB]KIC67165.1 hypothetical protein RK09_09700 [Kocuria rhizophila]KMK73909.1 hypothetical protein ACJ65_02870 [Kocuria rhizophila]KUP26750.1 hypothetical protein IX41_10245 [Kocuria rhizophila]
MGRGRQKAKATRQAREIKYFSPQTDYSALQRELRGTTPSSRAVDHEERPEDEDDYSTYVEKYSDYD